jgi:uncharacterized protein YrzB (UPF0473 family)
MSQHEDSPEIEEGIEDAEYVVLVDDEGNEQEFAMLLVVEFEGQEYAALTPADQLEDDGSEEQDIYLFAYEEYEDDSGEVVQSFSPIEDEELFEKVSSFCQGQFSLLAGIDEA